MTRSPSLCGSPTRAGSTCRNPVEQPGKKCHLHQGAASKRRIFSLCISVVEKVLAVCTLYEAYEKLYPLAAPWVHNLHGLLMPEHFWLAFDAGDVNAMRDELAKAKAEAAVRITARYDGYSMEEKRKVENAYKEILSILHEQGMAT